MINWKKPSMFFIIVLLLIAFVSIVLASDLQVPSLVVIPISGEPLTKLTFYGAGFVPGEKVRVILTVDDVPFAFGEVGTGGIVTVNEYGAFKLQPRGGIPKVMLKPGVYTIEAIGDKGSRATTPLEVLEKKE
ncbi:hypothetical protein ES695_04605 [Candidatus Atribacteria bacterium 1244-E10-H5-B2]|nr:MAG: hypothetical protein ES695_04605 [Candidatus Atribacteria bacterium 1244-E10-H5-B2]